VEVTINTLSDVSREVQVTTDADELRPHFEKAYKEYRAKVDLKGFRKGQALLDLIKKLYGEMIEHDSLGAVASELYREIVREKDLKPIGDPVITDMDYKRGQHLRFTVKYDIRPIIELKKYTGIEVEKSVHTVTDEELEEELLRLRRINSTLEEVPAAADTEHVVTTEIRELDSSGLPILGRKQEPSRFYLADPQLEQPIRDALTGAEVGKEYRAKFQHTHGDHTHDVHLALNVTKVEKVILPPLDDAFASKITKEKIKSLDELRSSVRNDLTAYWEEKNRRKLINDLIAELLRIHQFEVPDSLVQSVLGRLLEEVKNQSQKQELPEDFDIEKFMTENRAYAVYQSRWALLREELIAAEKLTVEDADVAAIAERESSRIGIDKERLVAYYKSSDQVRDRILTDKLIDALLGKAKIKEVQHHPSA